MAITWNDEKLHSGAIKEIRLFITVNKILSKIGNSLIGNLEYSELRYHLPFTHGTSWDHTQLRDSVVLSPRHMPTRLCPPIGTCRYVPVSMLIFWGGVGALSPPPPPPPPPLMACLFRWHFGSLPLQKHGETAVHRCCIAVAASVMKR
jgi:hypothetical protein